MISNFSKIRHYLKNLYFSDHAKDEMVSEEFGPIWEREVKEAILSGEIIEEYQRGKLPKSYLIYGKTKKGQPLHIVCAPLDKEQKLVIITLYRPDPRMWINFRRRKK